MKAIETIYCICMGGSPSLHIYATTPLASLASDSSWFPESMVGEILNRGGRSFFFLISHLF